MEEISSIIKAFTETLIKSGDYTKKGVQEAHKATISSFRMQDIVLEEGEFIPSTLLEEIEKNKPEIHVAVKSRPNKYGNIESANVKGLLLRKTDDDKYIAYGVQNGSKVEKIPVNFARLCYANGIPFDEKETVGSASKMTNPINL